MWLKLLKAGIKAVEQYENEFCKPINTFTFGGYHKSERKVPIFTRISDMINREQPDTVKFLERTWRGKKVKYFLIPKETSIDLLEELGEKYLSLFF